MTLIEVDIGIGGGLERERHLLLAHHEVDSSHEAVVIVGIENTEAIVAAELQTTQGIGQLELVMGVRHDGVERGLGVVDDEVVEALEPVALEHFGGRLPVGLMARHMTHVAMIGVGELVEADVEHIVGIQTKDGRIRQPILTHHSLEGFYLCIIDAVLGFSLYCQKGNTDYNDPSFH